MNNPWDRVMAAVTKLTDTVSSIPIIREARVDDDLPELGLFIYFRTGGQPIRASGSLQAGTYAPGDRVLVVQMKTSVWVLGRIVWSQT